MGNAHIGDISGKPSPDKLLITTRDSTCQVRRTDIAGMDADPAASPCCLSVQSSRFRKPSGKIDDESGFCPGQQPSRRTAQGDGRRNRLRNIRAPILSKQKSGAKSQSGNLFFSLNSVLFDEEFLRDSSLSRENLEIGRIGRTAKPTHRRGLQGESGQRIRV